MISSMPAAQSINLKGKLKIKVTNSGDKSGTTKVTLKSRNKKVKLPKSVKITIGAGETAVKKITVKAVKKAKGKAKITARTAGKSAKKVLKVKGLRRKPGHFFLHRWRSLSGTD